MKLTKTQLKRIIQEELQKVLYADQNSKQMIEEDWASRNLPGWLGGKGLAGSNWAPSDPKMKLDGDEPAKLRRRKREAKMGKDELQRKIDRARFLQRQCPSTSMTADEYERIHGKGSVEAANPRPDQPEESITVDEYERIHGKGSASSNYADCPRGQKQIGQRNDGSPICG